MAHARRFETDLVDRWNPLEVFWASRDRHASAHGLRFAGGSPHTGESDGLPWKHLEVFELQKGDLVVTDRANGLRQRIVFVLSKLADIIVRISPSKFPMEDEQGEALVVIDWLKGLQACRSDL